jgi:hypothetical protein
MAAQWCGREEKGLGVRGWHHVEGGNREERWGGAGTVGDSSGGTGRQRDPVGSDGVRERVRESGAARWWALTRGPGQHSAGRHG